MKVKEVLVSIALLMILGAIKGNAQQSFIKISDLVGKETKDRKGKLKKYTFSEIRRMLYKDCNSLLLHSEIENDTLYMLESFGMEEQTYYGRIWNRKAAIDYKYQQHSFTYFNQLRLFDTSTIKHVQNWDTTAISKEAELYGPTVSGRSIYATRVIINNSGAPLIDNFIYNAYLK